VAPPHPVQQPRLHSTRHASLPAHRVHCSRPTPITHAPLPSPTFLTHYPRPTRITHVPRPLPSPITPHPSPSWPRARVRTDLSSGQRSDFFGVRCDLCDDWRWGQPRRALRDVPCQTGLVGLSQRHGVRPRPYPVLQRCARCLFVTPTAYPPTHPPPRASSYHRPPPRTTTPRPRDLICSPSRRFAAPATTAVWQWRRDVDAEPTSADEAVWTNHFL